jgi:hypothetical protein
VNILRETSAAETFGLKNMAQIQKYFRGRL